MKKSALFLLLSAAINVSAGAQHSIARLWNEMLLDGIRTDLARPTVHARNLFHVSVAMYDAWAVYDTVADTYFLGKTLHNFTCPYRRAPRPADAAAAQEEAISFAVYRLLRHRFAGSPGKDVLFPKMDALMDSLGYNKGNVSINYKAGAAEMGNYIAYKLIEYGLQDGSNEANQYANQYYVPVNLPLVVETHGNPKVRDLNRWQPIQFNNFIDQSGNSFANFTPKFLSPEWGNVLPFSLQPADLTQHFRGSDVYNVYHDPGPPALLDTTAVGGLSEEYKWNHELVAIWSALLDPLDTTMIDISPRGQGNNQGYPSDIPGLRNFYDLFQGGDHSPGRTINPKTGTPYTSQWVRRGDFTRVLAEFWADGPASETPPGHWFTILNYVNDQPGVSRRMGGTGPECSPLEWDVKAYFILGGAMHDVAITAWGIKGAYDSSRPITAIRGMAELGQSSDPALPGFHPGGLQLVPGYVELIQSGDPLAGAQGQYVGEVKLKAWRGPGFINDPKNDVAGVGWIRAKVWWPYQRPTFVTPPFAGYISGHSTYSRAAAEVLTALTGDSYFPGGVGEFYCKKNEYLVFEDGPSADITLQWATYQDASDQCSLSRIYGGIHPPMDDIPGRLIGKEIGQEAFGYAQQFFVRSTPPEPVTTFNIFPNPTQSVLQLEYPDADELQLRIVAADGRLVADYTLQLVEGQAIVDLRAQSAGLYVLVVTDTGAGKVFEKKVVKL